MNARQALATILIAAGLTAGAPVAPAAADHPWPYEHARVLPPFQETTVNCRGRFRDLSMWRGQHGHFRDKSPAVQVYRLKSRRRGGHTVRRLRFLSNSYREFTIRWNCR